jgi:hydrogenase maturation protein HypF
MNRFPPVEPEVRHELAARRIVLRGRVQGLGVRPAVARLAARWNLAGSVANRLDGVEIVIEGTADQLDLFQAELLAALPQMAEVADIKGEAITVTGSRMFRIVERPSQGAVGAEVPRDLAVCADCLQEVQTRSDRRHAYSFTSCTCCGPRYSIVDRMPFERSLTSMTDFHQCPQCRDEFESLGDRRFHSQTNCCRDCGPQVWCVDPSGRILGRHDDAVQMTVLAIRQGKIAAVRGLGGYQLFCDATDEAAVGRLRKRKRRRTKPLAVMVESLQMALQLAELSDEEQRALTSAESPIVLVKARPDSRLAAGIHPGLADVGILLPTTPLHWLLAAETGRPLVCTSGNVEGDPLAVETAQAERDLAGVADLWLHHDRPIRRPIDDSVVRIIAGRQVAIRCARGLAPLQLPALELPDTSMFPILAMGGNQKAAIAICNGTQSILGPFIGDLEGIGTQARFVEQCRDFVDLYGAEPELVISDLHPDYFTTRWAHESGKRYFGVQHHHAHVVAGMLEQGWLDREVLGIAFDGTGFGLDGTIWGGEFLLTTASDFRRVGRLRPFPLPGAEAAIREPWRVAVAMVAEAAGPGQAMQLDWPGRPADQVNSVLAIRNSVRFSPIASSAGRLFDAVTALVFSIESTDFEGQAAMWLESACDPCADGEYDFLQREAGITELDWRPMIRQLLGDRADGVSPGTMAMRFHRGLAAATVAFVRKFAPLPVVLAGGTFQNRVLTELIVERMGDGNQPIGLPGLIPPNDGGLAAGQLAVACARLNIERSR